MKRAWSALQSFWAVVTALWARFISKTVWGKGTIPEYGTEYQLLPQLVLPVVDIGIISMGVVGARHYAPALEENLDPMLVDGISYALAITGILCLFGVTLPKLYLLELFSKWALIVAFIIYPAVVIGLALEGDDGRYVAAIGMLVAVPFFMLRTWVLVARYWRRHEVRAETKEILTRSPIV